MLNLLQEMAGQTGDAARRRQSSRSVNQEVGDDLYVCSVLLMCCEGIGDGKGKAGRQVVPSVGRSARLTMDNRFLICCQLFPFLASAGLGLGLGLGESGLSGSGLYFHCRRGGSGSDVHVSVQLVKGRTRFANNSNR